MHHDNYCYCKVTYIRNYVNIWHQKIFFVITWMYVRGGLSYALNLSLFMAKFHWFLCFWSSIIVRINLYRARHLIFILPQTYRRQWSKNRAYMSSGKHKSLFKVNNDNNILMLSWNERVSSLPTSYCQTVR